MEENKRFQVYKIIMLVVLVAFLTFLLTSIGMYQYFVNKNNNISSLSSSSDIQTTLNNYKSIIDKYYLGQVDEEKLKEGAIEGYISALNDPYTEYISKDDMKDYLDDAMGNFIGIGIYMVENTKEDKIQVLAPIKNSPAERAGLLPGDFIISVDGIQYKGSDMTVASKEIKGEADTTVKLEILRGTETKTFEIKREKIIVNPVEGKILSNNIGYIEFESFDEDTAEEFKTKFEELKNKGIKSLIIDLRNNGGGIVDEALKIADYFVDKGEVLLYEVDKNNNEEIKKASENPIINMPVVILTNENTASSSEILAGCLKDLGKAKIVGTNTFGKGIIQSILSLPDGSGLKVTTQKYLTPKKSEINEKGIEPDEVVELPETVENVLSVEEKDDTQLQRAIEILK